VLESNSNSCAACVDVGRAISQLEMETRLPRATTTAVEEEAAAEALGKC